MFNNSRNFSINKLYVSDGNGGNVEDVVLLDKLGNAACLDAGYCSDERYDEPKCHKNTRVAVVNDIMSWINCIDSKEPIMWMSAPAGAGKSAIAQTICEKCAEEKKLLASFFFSRAATGTGRGEGKRLVPTIACQLAIAIPEAKPSIIKQLENDYATLTYSMGDQLQKLVLEPLANLKSGGINDNRTPYVVVIDGLDECNDSKVQSRIVKMISGIFVQGQVPLRFFIASRPELAIRNSFEPLRKNGSYAQIKLDGKYKPDDDIRTYLRSEFSVLKREHTLHEYLLREAEWPTSEDIRILVERSSGQFIYASTVLRYLRNPRRDPREGLRAILGKHAAAAVQNNSMQNESPHTPLDSMYKHILSTASSGIQGRYDSFKIIFQILLYGYQRSDFLAALNPDVKMFTPMKYQLSYLIGMEQHEADLLLADLHSILYVPDSCSKDTLKLYHASFGDFLKNSSRSENFYISSSISHRILSERCFSIMSSIDLDMKWAELNDVQKYSVDHCFEHLKDSDFHEELLIMLRSGGKLRNVMGVLAKFKRYNALKR